MRPHPLDHVPLDLPNSDIYRRIVLANTPTDLLPCPTGPRGASVHRWRGQQEVGQLVDLTEFRECQDVLLSMAPEEYSGRQWREWRGAERLVDLAALRVNPPPPPPSVPSSCI